MRIIVYGINFYPELTGIGKYTGEMVEWLAKQGHQVRVITAPPYYPEWRVLDGYSPFSWKMSWWNGAKIFRCPLWVPQKPMFISRILHLFSFAFSSFPILLGQLFWRPQIIWVVEPSIFCTPFALGLARLCGAKTWLHVQDFEIDAAFSLGMVRIGVAKKIALWMEAALMKRFDIVSSISNRMLEHAKLKGVPAGRLNLFPNWVNFGSNQVAEVVDDSDLLKYSSSVMYRKKLGIPSDSIIILYSGNMGAKQGLEILAEVANLFCKRNDIEGHLRFVFCGSGAYRASLYAQCMGLKNVNFLDLQPAESLSDFLAMADIHILPQRADVADLVMPSKLSGIFASGRPVLVCANLQTELAEVVCSRGLVVPPENVEALYAGLVKLAQDANLRKTLGAAAKKYALENLEKNNVLCKFEKQLYHLVGK
jgi:colanic acid biosynthesis glycosyl transferase WcaI